MKLKKIILFIIILAIFAGFFSLFFIFYKDKNSKQDLNINYIKINEQIIKVEVANTVGLQEKGLSGREKLEENTGMLFIFKNPARYSFWMKDMKFALDIIWLDQDGKIIFIKKSVAPETFPETFMSEQDAKYVLEVKSGFSEKNNLQVGDFVKFLH
jgi:uncharacterized membrane protein (UPF0127 family)